MKRFLRRWLGVDELDADITRMLPHQTDAMRNIAELREDLDNHWHGSGLPLNRLTTTQPRFPRAHGRVLIPGSAASQDKRR